MNELQINGYAFLGVVEFSLLLLVVTLVFVIRSTKLAGRLRVAQGKLKKAGQAPESVSFDQYLRDALTRNQDLIDSAAASEDDAEKKAAELLKTRTLFLELELEARALENSPVAFQGKLAAGLSGLIEQLSPVAETGTETHVAVLEADLQAEQAAAAQVPSEQRTPLDTHDAEFDRLKVLINNQQDAIEALRREMQARDNGIDDLDAIESQRLLDQQQRAVEPQPELAAEAVSEDPDAEHGISFQDERDELEIKVQELEALVEFKDAAIDELEKQYSKREARFLAASGDKE